MEIDFFWDYIIHRENPGKIIPVGKKGTSYEIYYDRTKKDNLRVKWNAIKNFFCLEGDDATLFKLFQQAATGLERGRITQLNSSSLFAFLYFHSVAEHAVSIKGFDQPFTHVTFEVGNTIDDKTLPNGYGTKYRPVSHIDVVLSNQDSALLLECKFSEYLEHYSSLPANASKKAYSAFYEKLFDNGGIEGLDCGELTDANNKQWVILKRKDGGPCYFDGLKQTIAHFMGAQGILDSGRKIKQFNFAGKEIHLAEVVFNFSNFNSLSDDDVKERQNALNDYKKFHNRLCEKLKTVEVAGGRDIIVHPDLLYYQDSFELKLPSAFVDFYNLQNPLR